MSCVTEALRQFAAGEDYWTLAQLTGDLSPEQACTVPAGSPYSIATQVGHALVWQERWLAIVRGEEVNESLSDEEDFPSVSPDEWPAIRERFVATLDAAQALAQTGEPELQKRLLQIALHGSYHVGQIALLRHLAGFVYPPEIEG